MNDSKHNTDMNSLSVIFYTRQGLRRKRTHVARFTRYNITW